ncbi:uncharacterized protein [Montipora capricornis]|uniref:uncharacterized protein n=1 Tax=Montipora capricornis TaxID=246305 RepID=UPI0035F196F8
MFVRCWRAKTDGWSVSTFHRNCDGKGPTVTIIKVGSYIFGGYTDVSWSSSCAHASSSKPFIYSLYNINGHAPVKLQIKSGRQSYAIYSCSRFGPSFGGGTDIYISNNAASNRISHTYCGHTYPLPRGYSSSGYSCTFYAGSYMFTPTDIEVFCERALHVSALMESLPKNQYLVKLNSFLVPVLQSSSRSRFVRCWRAKTDGWAATTFHSNCDGKGPTVTIIKVGSYIFGGYTDVSWSSSCAYASSSKSFIYSLYNINGYAPVKLQVKSGRQSFAIHGCSSYGPTFGSGHDIHISNNAASNRDSYTSCGYSYPLPPGYSSSRSSCRFFAGGGSHMFTPTDVEVF